MANDTPLMPLRKVHDLWAWAKADPSNTRDYICGLVAATADAVLAAMRHGRAGGWIFGQECFIRAVCAIRDLNAKGTVHTYGTDLAQRLPTNWRKLADAVESYARDIPRQMRWTGERPPDSIPRDIISPEYDKPIDSHALQGLFDYCLAKAKAAFPAESDIMEMQYKTLVFNFPLNTTQTLSRLEAGQGGMHRRMQTAEERAEARHRETLAAIAAAAEANGGKLDTVQAKVNETQAAANLAAKNSAAAKRTAENIAQDMAGLPAAIAEVKAEAAGAKVAAEGARTAAEKGANNSETTGRLVLNHMTPRPGDYEVKQKGLSEILEGLKAKVTVKTIQRWEKYLATNGKEGTKPPEGYTLQTRQTLAGATAWAKTYAAREKLKLNTKVSLDRLTGGRH